MGVTETIVEALLVIGFVAALIYLFVLFGRSAQSRSVSTNRGSPKKSVREPTHVGVPVWLQKRWADAMAQRESGAESRFPAWYYDSVTEKQKKRLSESGFTGGISKLTKGQASDLIGLVEEPEDWAIERLRFFKLSTKGLCQTEARMKVEQLMANPENVKRWDNRPATAQQREHMKFYGEAVQKGIKATEAERLLAELEERFPSKAEALDNLQCIFDEFDDRDMREMMSTRKPTKKALQEAIDKLIAEGKTLDDLASDTQVVADKLIELYPDLEHEYDQ